MMRPSWWKQELHKARRVLAKFWLRLNPQVTIIGITGSYGKTNTTRAIAEVLSQKYQTLQTDLNLDTVYNLPITILKLRPWHQKLVLEMGVDHKNEMDFHLWLAKPTIAIITGINPTHSDQELLGSLERIIEEKKKLLLAVPENGLTILNWDDIKVRKMAVVIKKRIIWYGTDKKNCDFFADKIKVDFSGTSFRLFHKGNGIPVKTGLVGRHFVHSCLAAAAVGIDQGLSWGQIKNGLRKLKPLKGRLSIEVGPNDSILLNDALRANPASTFTGLQTLVDLPAKGQRIAVLGEMGELGESAEMEHCHVGKKVAELNIDYFIGIGSLQKFAVQQAIQSGMKKERVFWSSNVYSASEILRPLLKKGDLFYLKGSLLRHLERVRSILERRKVGCRVVSCYFYHQCSFCPYLRSGPPEDIMKKMTDISYHLSLITYHL